MVESESGVVESDCGESMLQGLMPSGLPQAPVNSTGVAKQEVGYEVVGEVNKDGGDSND